MLWPLTVPIYTLSYLIARLLASLRRASGWLRVGGGASLGLIYHGPAGGEGGGSCCSCRAKEEGKEGEDYEGEEWRGECVDGEEEGRWVREGERRKEGGEKEEKVSWVGRNGRERREG